MKHSNQANSSSGNSKDSNKVKKRGAWRTDQEHSSEIMRINENQYNVGAERPVTFKQIKATSNDKRDELICTYMYLEI